MGIHAIPAKMLGNVPTYYVDDTLQEDAGNGNIRVWNYERMNGVLIPQFKVIIASRSLLLVGRKVADFAQSVFNEQEMRLLGDKVH
jgi:hypothetical protein